MRYAKGCAIRDSATTGFDEAVSIARASDVVVVVLGGSSARASDVVVVVLGGSSARDFETQYKSTGAAIASETTVSDMENGEGNDRSTLRLLGRQSELLEKISATGKPVILILINGRPLAIEKEAGMAGDILEAWYPGAEGGRAIAEILFGDYGPTGRLPISFPKAVGQLPVYYSQLKGSGGHYVEADGRPLYPFGYGLSYATFAYSDLQIEKSEAGNAVHVDISFKVTNTGKVASGDLQQLYVTDQTSSVVTPIRRLAGFARCYLAPGASAIQHIRLAPEALSLWNNQGKQVIEPGYFQLELSRYAGDPKAVNATFQISRLHALE